MADVRIFVVAEGVQQAVQQLGQLNQVVQQQGTKFQQSAAANLQAVSRLSKALSGIGTAFSATALASQFGLVSRQATAMTSAINASALAITAFGRATKAALPWLVAAAAAIKGFDLVMQEMDKRKFGGEIAQLTGIIQGGLSTGVLGAERMRAFNDELERLSKLRPKDQAEGLRKLAEEMVMEIPKATFEKHRQAGATGIGSAQLSLEAAMFGEEQKGFGRDERGVLERGTEAIENALVEQQNLLMDARKQDLITEEEYTAEYTRLANERFQNEKRLIEGKRALRDRDLTASVEALNLMANAAKQYGREGFIAWKAFSIASAVISTYSSALKAYESTVGIPYVGPIIAPIAAGAAVAFGTAQVAQIASQSFRIGGYTGDGPATELAGSVHRREFVMPESAVDYWGLDTMEAMRSGEAPIATAGGERTAIVLVDSREKANEMDTPGFRKKIIQIMGEEMHNFRR